LSLFGFEENSLVIKVNDIFYDIEYSDLLYLSNQCGLRDVFNLENGDYYIKNTQKKFNL
jgi:hypothetical protein